MEMVLIKIDSEEWEYMWNWLRNHPINHGLDNPVQAKHPINHEVWQYIGSYKNRDRVIHELRHRFHPVTQKLEKLSLLASNEFSNDQIEKVVKI